MSTGNLRHCRSVIYDEEGYDSDMSTLPTPTPSLEGDEFEAEVKKELAEKKQDTVMEESDVAEAEESDDDSSEDDSDIDPDESWRYLLEAATKTVTVQVGNGLLSNRYLVECYGSGILEPFRNQEWVIPESVLKPVPNLLARAMSVKTEVKTEDGEDTRPSHKRVISLPDTLPMVFAELLRWLQDKAVTPQHLPSKSWKGYYEPIHPEDIGVAICEFGDQYNVKQFHNCGIDMLAYGDTFSFYTPDSSASILAKKVAARNGVSARVSKMLIMCWALHDIKLKGTQMQIDSHCDGAIMGAYYDQFFKVMKKNEKKAMSQAKKFDYPALKEYYLI